MLKNYFKVALRNLVRHKGFSAINIAGLAVGMASCILIFLYVQDELSYDRYHEKADRIYRLEREGKFNDKEWKVPITAHPMGPAMVSEFPEVVDAVRFQPLGLMVRNRDNALCCGGGGGGMWLDGHISEHGGQRLSDERIRQAADTGAEVLAVSCPFELSRFEDSAKVAGLEERLMVRDIIELLAQSMGVDEKEMP